MQDHFTCKLPALKYLTHFHFNISFPNICNITLPSPTLVCGFSADRNVSSYALFYFQVLRPFLLRRLKSEVEKQMPKKYEHVVMCRLSKRQRFLYDDFMSRAKTKETLASGNLLSVINVLMQLRKVCNHPNMFETRPTVSPFRMDGIDLRIPSSVYNILDYDPDKHVALGFLNMLLADFETSLSAYTAYRVKKLQTPRRLIEEIDTMPSPPPPCPVGQFKMYMRIREANVSENITTYSGVKVGTSPAMKTEGTKIVPVNSNLLPRSKKSSELNLLPIVGNINSSTTSNMQANLIAIPPLTSSTPTQSPVMSLRRRIEGNVRSIGPQFAQLLQTSSGRQIIITPSSSSTTVVTPTGHRLTVVKSTISPQQQKNIRPIITKPLMKVSPMSSAATHSLSYMSPITAQSLPSISLATTTFTSSLSSLSSTSSASSTGAIPNAHLTSKLAQQLKNHSYAPTVDSTKKSQPEEIMEVESDSEFILMDKEELLKERRRQKLQFIARCNRRRCEAVPMYGSDLRETIYNRFLKKQDNSIIDAPWFGQSYLNCYQAAQSNENWSLNQCIKSYESRTNALHDIFNNFILFVPAVSAPMPELHVSHPKPSKLNKEQTRELVLTTEMSPKITLLHPIISAMSTQVNRFSTHTQQLLPNVKIFLSISVSVP